MIPSPCKDCKFRSYSCQSTCAKYIDFQQMYELEKNKRNEYNMYANQRNQKARGKY